MAVWAAVSHSNRGTNIIADTRPGWACALVHSASRHHASAFASVGASLSPSLAGAASAAGFSGVGAEPEIAAMAFWPLSNSSLNFSASERRRSG